MLHSLRGEAGWAPHARKKRVVRSVSSHSGTTRRIIITPSPSASCSNAAERTRQCRPAGSHRREIGERKRGDWKVAWAFLLSSFSRLVAPCLPPSLVRLCASASVAFFLLPLPDRWARLLLPMRIRGSRESTLCTAQDLTAVRSRIPLSPVTDGWMGSTSRSLVLVVPCHSPSSLLGGASPSTGR